MASTRNIRFNREISQADLNIENKTRSNPFSWRGQFSPQLIELLIQTYANTNTYILDPFVGSGTVLLEAGRLGLSAVGSEVNPAALKLSQTYKLININPADRLKLIAEAENILARFQPPFFSLDNHLNEHNQEMEIRNNLINLVIKTNNELIRSLLETLVIMLDFNKKNLTHKKILQVWKLLKTIIENIPFSENPISLHLADARNLPIINNNVDLVITSPPYINVMNYHQQYRTSIEALGWDVLESARSEIGSNRKNRKNRFLTVVQYCFDMEQVFRELVRVCKPNAIIIFVIGRVSNVKRTKFYNSEILEFVATKAVGLDLTDCHERVFRNKFGYSIYEDILVFNSRKSKIQKRIEVEIKEVARQVLEVAGLRAPKESFEDLKIAINEIPNVSPSKLFTPCLPNPITK